jgi:hypothetical protein
MKLSTIAVMAVAAGAYLRFGSGPVVASYRVGRNVERLIADPARFNQVFRIGYRIGKRRGQSDWPA